MFRVLISMLFFLSYSTISQAQNFEGIIVYDQQNDKGNYALIRYYFKDHNLRIEADFFNDGQIDRYTTIYRFNEYPNQRFELGNNLFIAENSSPDKAIKIEDQDAEINKHLGFDLKKYTKYYEHMFQGEIETKTELQFHYSDKLIFELPPECNSEPYMLSQSKGKIALVMKVVSTNDLTEGYSYTRAARTIKEISLPDSLFEIR